MADLYERDFAAWLQAQLAALRARDSDQLDWSNLIEEVEALADYQEKEVRTRLEESFRDLLLWRRSSARDPQWAARILANRLALRQLVRGSPSLQAFYEKVYQQAFDQARADLAADLNEPLDALPPHPSELLEDAFSVSRWAARDKHAA